MRSLSRMTVFLVYAHPSSTLSLLIVMQAEIPGQEQDDYDTEPNFFHGMHQVCTIAYLIPLSLTLFITAFSKIPTTAGTAPRASEQTEARYDDDPSFSSPATTGTCTCTSTSTSSYTYHPTINRRSYHPHSAARKPIPLEVRSYNTARRRCSVREG
ncbi:hypothetical protein DFJ58DRAFT_212814 [Suillus subalutaceus]|uniref:uncharacterized protein n=1 Tax=Suillus subalutaceus TaxID=48586 RepID=UPI001B86F6CF|nr:uncharacterized protein DFJ58DRAFT_212814 [Suillus subalutaceus]KAG1863538.1 hypothetical protein DFJ58DRAFT_212814 [Suillus subalutaceus]